MMDAATRNSRIISNFGVTGLRPQTGMSLVCPFRVGEMERAAGAGPVVGAHSDAARNECRDAFCAAPPLLL